MRLINYQNESEYGRRYWLDSIVMMVGLKYFGGKTMIGRYLINRICDLALSMKMQGRPADVFVDAFTGGGKIGLTIPNGWFDTIIMNDLNRAVFSYYMSCKYNYVELINAIEKIGNYMSNDFFDIAIKVVDNKYNSGVELNEDNMIILGALEYWVTATSFNGQTDINKASYLYNNEDEKDAIRKIVKTSHNRVEQIHEKLCSQNYILECLDYKDLIIKYNKNGNKNILWYFDPPYHPYCLYAGKEAPYANTFTPEAANEMINILANKNVSIYGELEYFIKSDYDPIETYNKALKVCNEKNLNISKSEAEWYAKILNLGLEKLQDITKPIEDASKGYRKECLGGFDKHTVRNTDANNIVERTIGMEYVWIRDIGYI